jgi:hypothetical protein
MLKVFIKYPFCYPKHPFYYTIHFFTTIVLLHVSVFYYITYSSIYFLWIFFKKILIRFLLHNLLLDWFTCVCTYVCVRSWIPRTHWPQGTKTTSEAGRSVEWISIVGLFCLYSRSLLPLTSEAGRSVSVANVLPMCCECVANALLMCC